MVEAGTRAGQGRTETVRTIAGKIGLNRRFILLVFAAIWIVDGALKFQPDLVGRTFATSVIDPMASGQPAPIAWAITSMGNFIEPDAALWVVLFGIVEIAIGVGLLLPKYLKQTLVVMFVWIFFISFFGEGLEMFFTGTASPLTGAPGVLTYALIGITLWPTGAVGSDGDGGGRPKIGLDSAPAATGLGGMNFGLAAWAVLWSFFAFLWLLPMNRTRTSIYDAMNNAGGGEPGWYSGFLDHVARHFVGSGTQWAWIMMILALAIGLGPLVSRHPGYFFLAGALVALVFWITGQGLGEVMTGAGTDPNGGPLVILFALSLMPTVMPVHRASPVPLRTWAKRHPTALGLSAALVIAALVLSATYPVAGSTASGQNGSSTTQCMAGMAMAGCSSP